MQKVESQLLHPPHTEARAGGASSFGTRVSLRRTRINVAPAQREAGCRASMRRIKSEIPDVFSSFATLAQMGALADKRRWLEQVVTLRRAERAAPGVREIPEVRAQLEVQIGSAVSMSLAASILDVSEATIRRWVRRGDLPTVISPSGRPGIPVGELADLYEDVAEQRSKGRKHVLEPRMVAARQAAERMEIDVDLPAGSTHDRSLARALAYHRAVARKLTRPMADTALHRVWEWESQGRIDADYARRWELLLRGPLREIREQIGASGAEADDLRQNSPFAGALSEPERQRIVAEVR